MNCEICDAYVDTDLHEMYKWRNEDDTKDMDICERCDAELSGDEEPMPAIEGETTDDITAAAPRYIKVA